ncbi:MAG: tyrosine transporter [Cyanobacteria bacterium]|nr:tyrosine transporter [Cyanobacteriota bacterium]MDA0865736.1 tyrosine transporter [Cyanobacteriota bacterium]
MTRFFSNLEFDGIGFKHRPGSLVACTALIAGTTVGAGILALPAVTLPAGILPSTTMLIAVWIYMVVSGLLVAEVNLNTMYTSGQPRLGLLATVQRILGRSGAIGAGGVYLFIHYALLVAYMARGGSILATALGRFGPVETVLPNWVGSALFVGLFGGLIYFGSERWVGRLNGAFFAILLVAFGGLLALTLSDLNPAQFLNHNWAAVGAALPVMFVALVYQNVVPIVTTRLEGDISKIRWAIILGSLIPLVMFLGWNAAILGSGQIDPTISQPGGTLFDPLEFLRRDGSNQWTSAGLSIFSEFAIATSFIGLVYGLLNFLGDAFGQASHGVVRRWPLFSLVLVPPMGLSTLNAGIFFEALDYAGTFGISVLFGIVPAVMAWKERYPTQAHRQATLPLVPGGKITLMLMIGIAMGMIAEQVLAKLGWL